jgi:prepilin-type processing-associated H-X9-DG protein
MFGTFFSCHLVLAIPKLGNFVHFWNDYYFLVGCFILSGIQMVVIKCLVPSQIGPFKYLIFQIPILNDHLYFQNVIVNYSFWDGHTHHPFIKR